MRHTRILRGLCAAVLMSRSGRVLTRTTQYPPQQGTWLLEMRNSLGMVVRHFPSKRIWAVVLALGWACNAAAAVDGRLWVWGNNTGPSPESTIAGSAYAGATCFAFNGAWGGTYCGWAPFYNAVFISTVPGACYSGYTYDPWKGTCGAGTPEPPNTCTAGSTVGHPIAPATGEKVRTESDWADNGPAPLSFTRFYRSGWANSAVSPSAGMGNVWSHSYFTRLQATPSGAPISIIITLPEGYARTFAPAAVTGTWAANDSADTLSSTSAGAWIWHRSEDDSTYTFDASGRLQTRHARNGWADAYAYNGVGQLASVTNAFGRSLAFAYDGDNLASVTTPDGRVIRYGYDASARLTSVTYADGQTRTFLYENTSYPQALTGIQDEAGQRWATFAYNNGRGWATSTTLAGGADSYQVDYPSTGTATVTDPLGTTRTYTYSTAQGKLAVTSGSRPSNTGQSDAASRVQDANGLITKETDFNGGATTTAWDSTRRLPITITRGADTPLAQTETIQWHATFNLPVLVTEPGRSTAYAYDTKGNLITETVTDTSASPNLVRQRQWTYNDKGLVSSATEANGAVTKYAYDAFGNLSQVTNALGHITQYAYDKANRLISETAPNGVVTTYTWDARDHLLTQTVGGQQTTVLTYNATGTLVTLTQPNGARLAYIYDAAHRLTGIQDDQGNRIEYTLNGAGDRVAENMTDANGNPTRTLVRGIDALGRIQQITGRE